MTKKIKKTTPPRRNGFLVWGISAKLRKDFKMACLRRDVPMRKVISDYMIQFASENPTRGI